MTLQAGSARSRLDPEPVPRRDFLGLAALWSAAASLAFAFVGALRLPKAAVLPSPSRKFRITLPDSLEPGVAYVPPGRQVAVVRDAGGVYAISTICTHLGCIVKPSGEGFECPCHGSRFGVDGSVTKGPAPQPLPWFQVSGKGSELIVDAGTVVPFGSKVNL